MKELAKEYFKNNPGKEVVYATSDGCFFDQRKGAMNLHARRSGKKALTFYKADFVEEVKEKQTPKKDK